MSAVDDDGADPDGQAEALAFFEREATAEVDVAIDERARRSSPPPAVAVAPAVEIGPSISPSATTRTYDVVAPGDAAPTALMEQMRRSEAPTERHATVMPQSRPIPLPPATPTRLGLPRIEEPESARLVEPLAPPSEPPPPGPAAVRAARPRRQLPRVDSGVLRAHGHGGRSGSLRTVLALLALALVAGAIAAALLR